jgi:sodium-dependent dicarboxylate transporter 2/3/5
MAIVLILCVLVAAWQGIEDVKLFRATAVAGVVLALWLTEVIPLFATTFVLWIATVLALGPLDAQTFGLHSVLATAGSPVLALFLGGFALSVAGAKFGIDTYIAWWMVKVSRGDRRLLLAAIMLGTAVLSMWMSNIAAAAMMIATLRPLLEQGTQRNARGFRTALLLGIAFAANFGGIGTPIGTGPNLIAIGELSSRTPITFLHWMMFGVPVAMMMVALAYGLLVLLHFVKGTLPSMATKPVQLTRSGWCVVILFFLAVAGWMLEPVHGVPAAVVALMVMAALFGSHLLSASDLRRIEWNTLLLVAGGLTFGYLLEESGLAGVVAGGVNWNALPPSATLFVMLAGCAILSALASNTAAAAMIIPIALSIRPSPSIAILVALAASMGAPFVFSTPPNSLAYGQGGFASRELFVPGLLLMLIGCGLLTFLGPTMMRMVGVP